MDEFSTIGVYDREQPKTATDFSLDGSNASAASDKTTPKTLANVPSDSRHAAPIQTLAPPTLCQPARVPSTTTTPYRQHAQQCVRCVMTV